MNFRFRWAWGTVCIGSFKRWILEYITQLSKKLLHAKFSMLNGNNSRSFSFKDFHNLSQLAVSNFQEFALKYANSSQILCIFWYILTNLKMLWCEKVGTHKCSPSFFSKTQANQIDDVGWYEMKPESEEFKIVLVCGKNHKADINDMRAGVEFCC